MSTSTDLKRPTVAGRIAALLARQVNRRATLRRGAQAAFAFLAAGAVGLRRGQATVRVRQGGAVLEVAPASPAAGTLSAATRSLVEEAAAAGALRASAYRVLSVRATDADGLAAADPEQLQAVVYDYERQRALLVQRPLRGAGGTRVEVTDRQPWPSQDEVDEAIAVVRRAAPRLAGPGTQAYLAMPAVTTHQGEDGRPRRIVTIGLATRRGGATHHEVVGVDPAEGRVLERVEGLARPARRDCGGRLGNGCRDTGDQGQARIQVWEGDRKVWELVGVRPAASSGFFGSGAELVNVRYRGRQVLRRAHVPIVTVAYKRNRGNCGPSYRDAVNVESCFRAVGRDIAPGVRLCRQRPATQLDGDDRGNFRGLAIYLHGGELLLTSELEAGWYRYQTEWWLAMDGTIRAAFRFGAVSNPCTCYDHVHHAYFRLDFDLDGHPNRVEEHDQPDPTGGPVVRRLTREARRPRDPKRRRRWVVRSAGGGMAYAIEPGPYDGTADRYGAGDLWVLRYRPSEVDDHRVARGTQAALNRFVNGEPVLDQDLVVWYGVHLPHVAGRLHTQRLGPTLRPLGGER